MSWNYRVVNQNNRFGIYEAYYNDDGIPTSISKNSVSPEEDDLNQLKNTLELMIQALDKDILKYSDFL